MRGKSGIFIHVSDREKLKEAEFDSKLYSTMRSNFAKEGKKIAGELENDKNWIM